jgi:hydrogenase expression/formation protein HypC
MEILGLENNGEIAKVGLSGNILKVNTSLVNAKLGDYVLVHAGCALEVLSKNHAAEILALFGELEELVTDGSH